MAKQAPPISLRLSPDLLRQFEAYCQQRRRRRGEMLRLLVEDALAADATATPGAAGTGAAG